MCMTTQKPQTRMYCKKKSGPNVRHDEETDTMLFFLPKSSHNTDFYPPKDPQKLFITPAEKSLFFMYSPTSPKFETETVLDYRHSLV